MSNNKQVISKNSNGTQSRTVVMIQNETIPSKATRNRVPIHLTLVVDCSGSMAGSRINAAIEAIENIYQQLLKNDKIAVIVFNDTFQNLLYLREKSAVNFNQLKADIRKSVGGGTALYDAIFESIDKISYSPDESKNQREIIILTDGEDNKSKKTFEEIKKVLRNPKRKNLHITLIGCGIENSYEDKLINLTDSEYAQYLSTSAAESAIKRTFEDVWQNKIITRIIYIQEVQTYNRMSSDDNATTSTFSYSRVSNNNSVSNNFPKINLDNINLTDLTTTCMDNFSVLSLDNPSTTTTTKGKCKFGSKCNNDSCKYDHSLDDSGPTTTKIKCKFGSKCNNNSCKYDHSLDDSTKGKCKFGSKCNNDSCKYVHS